MAKGASKKPTKAAAPKGKGKAPAKEQTVSLFERKPRSFGIGMLYRFAMVSCVSSRWIF